MAALAKTVGLQKSNLLAALAGRRPMPADSAGRLWRAIGIDDAGGLAADRVHYWKVRHADDLALVERMWFSSSERLALRGANQSPDHAPLAYLIAGLNTQGGQEVFATVSGKGIDTLAGDSVSTPALLIANIDDIANGKLTPDTVRRLLADRTEPNEAPKSWGQFVRQAKALGLTPEQTWRLVDGTERNTK